MSVFTAILVGIMTVIGAIAASYVIKVVTLEATDVAARWKSEGAYNSKSNPTGEHLCCSIISNECIHF